MGAEYEMREFNLADGQEGKLLYPRLRLQGCIDLEQIAREIAVGTTYAASEVKASVEEVLRRMAYHMGMGYSVKIDGLGTFTPSLGLRKGKERESGVEGERRRNASSIEVRSVRFNVDKELVRQTRRQCSLSRSTKKFCRSSTKYTPEERLSLARQYLERNPSLTVGVYCALTGLLQSSATRELRRWAQTPGSGIGVDGFASHRVYVKRREETATE